MILCSLISSSLFADPVQPKSLKEFYLLAREATSRVQNRVLDEVIANNKVHQARAQLFPALSVTDNHTWRDRADVGAFGEGYQRSSFFTLSQPLFQGGSEFHLLNVAQRLPDVARLEREQAEIELFAEVALLFHRVVQLRNDTKTLQEQETTLSQRVQTLEKRAEIGRSKMTEVLAARSQLARVRADTAQVTAQLLQVEKVLMSLTGLQRIGPLKNETSAEDLMIPASWGEMLLESPRIKAHEILFKNAETKVKAAKGSYLPTLSLDANYYLNRSGILSESDWDAVMSMEWKFFSGGEDRAEVRIQRLNARKLKRELEEIKRISLSNFKNGKKEHEALLSVLKKLKKAVHLSRQNYEEHLKEANRGLVSQLETLRALEDYLNLRRTYEQQVYARKVSWYELQALAGVLP